ncbi:SDR family NAD(P)-dependent oxidoreductase [Aidingimonas halophila]|uniref:NAD(P)-dependent dehydrogenase, short-chain alcohol dehydrogenase family n=1 Tax=Aidingimonas halophila TaxID=574349 RepID=A0A1H3CIM3_9GAMM|nr:SDR family oxidoreductase [Aidingimonas halophila]GHC35489.1 short-chain dehydrogenase [Aidingimonas halophila]SDX53319.1 NAD(P)-dependent dehydrogenase, short-chain alcohol dehydrogenase family [Aidingimonas halophila]
MPSNYRNLFDLHGRTAIVTGGTGILGRHFCRALADYGANVVIADLDGVIAESFAEQLQQETGTSCIGLACDVACEDSVEALMTNALERFGSIDVVHNNAASKSDDLEAFFAPVEAYSLAEWRKIMAVNLDGVFLVSRSAGRRMIEQGRGGSIIHTGSIYGHLGSDPRIYAGSEYLGVGINTPPVYAASKAGVDGLARYLATQWAEYGIRVNTLVPGGVESGQNETFQSRYSQRVPLGRMAQADDLVGALIYLASDASRYVTGQSLFVDGGLSAW